MSVPSRSSAPHVLILAGLLGSLLLFAGCGDDKKKVEAKPAAAATAGFTTDEQKVSYGLGYNMGRSAASQGGFKMDKDALKAGLEDGLGEGKTRVSEAEIQAAFQVIQQRVQAVVAAEGQKQLTEGAAFLARNKARAGVKTTASGLQYEVLKAAGKGPKARPTDTVVVSYHGTLIDGTVFDSSVERGDTATFAVNGVIPGWTEALQLMSAGDKFKLCVPANLAYGPRARGKIPANAVLIFEVELKEIKAAK